MKNVDDTIEFMKKKFGSEPELKDTVLKAFHDKQFSVVEAMRGIRNVYGISLGEAKNIVAQSPLWKNEVEAGDKLHEEVLNVIDKE
jgi:ribosomal protein L7/L12